VEKGEKGARIVECIQLEIIANGIVIHLINNAENSALHANCKCE